MRNDMKLAAVQKRGPAAVVSSEHGGSFKLKQNGMARGPSSDDVDELREEAAVAAKATLFHKRLICDNCLCEHECLQQPLRWCLASTRSCSC